MLAITGISLIALSAVVFFWTLKRGVYRRYPYELFLLVGAAAALGLLGIRQESSFLNVGVFVFELAVLTFLTWYMSVGARFRRGHVSVRQGDRFPHFELPDSRGGVFRSESLVGESAALFLFYRGDW